MGATLEDTARIALALPEVVEGERRGTRTWSVGDKCFAWERPFSKADVKRFGDENPPGGPILAVRVLDLEDKEALLAEGHKGLFTIEHFNGYPAVLIQLDAVARKPLRDVLEDGWLTCAPERLAAPVLARRR